jgi:hypothetical protein
LRSSFFPNRLKRWLGLVWMALAVATVAAMVVQARTEITAAVTAGKAVADTRMFWFIVLPVFTPIMIGLGLFGYYAWKDEYGGR